MKNRLKYLLFLLPLAFIACSGEEEFVPADEPQPGDALEISVTVGDFVTVGDAPDTRATDNGAVTTFENGDRVGVIVLEGGNPVANNLPYKYDGANWIFDTQTVSNEGSGKELYYYDNQATDVTYIVYYPYSTAANGVTTIEGDNGLKNKFQPKDDQSGESDYRDSDLMYWQPDNTETQGKPLKKLKAELKHAYASVSLLPKVTYTLDDGNSTSFIHPSPKISDVILIIGDEFYSPYKADDGSYRCILPVGFTEGDVRCFYTLDGTTTYSNTIRISSPVTANVRYASTQKVDAIYSLGSAQVGDFYCRKNDDTGYLVPSQLISSIGSHTCVGLVFYVGQHDSDTFDYSSTGIRQSKCHGYVMALTDVNQDDSDRLYWEYKDGTYNQKVGASTSADDWLGYSNTAAIQKFIKDNSNAGWKISHFPAANGCINFGEDSSKEWQKNYAAPSNSSGWFLPSAGQLKYLYANRTDLSARINSLNDQLKGSNIKWFSMTYYWSSSEVSDSWYAAYAASFSHDDYGGYVGWNGKGGPGAVRALCAF